MLASTNVPFRANDFLDWQAKAPAWNELGSLWIQRMRGLGVDPANLLAEVEMDMGQVGRGTYPDAYVWWRQDQVATGYDQAQRFWFDHPNTNGMLDETEHHEATGGGGALTLSHLTAANGDPMMTGAILFVATMMTLERVEAERVGISFAQYRMLSAINSAARTYCHEHEFGRLYRHPIKYALPQSPIGAHRYVYAGADAPPAPPSGAHATDVKRAMRWMAECHAAFFQRWRPTRVRFPVVMQPAWQDRIETLRKAHLARKAANAAQAAQRQQEWDEQRRAEQAARQAFLAKHPRHEQWRGISDEVLTRDIWSKPTWELADEFGISDVAIAKECRKRGIPKPERGFWNKVTAGKLPHPNGVPPQHNDRKPTRRRSIQPHA